MVGVRRRCLWLAILCLLVACSALIHIDDRYLVADAGDARAQPSDGDDTGLANVVGDVAWEATGFGAPSEDVVDATHADRSALDQSNDADSAPPDELTDISNDAPSAPQSVAPTHLQLWLTADVGLTCTSGRVTQWADQSPNHRDASPQLNQVGPQCQIVGSPHRINGIDVPYFSAPVSMANPNVVDETLDVDLAFLRGRAYTIFAVERRWADYPAGDIGHFELVLGTNAQDESTFVGGCSNPVLYNTILQFGYVYYGPDSVDLVLDQNCNTLRAKARGVPANPPAAPSIDIGVFDMQRGHALWQGGLAVGIDTDQTPLSYAGGGAIGRAAAHTTAPGFDARFRGDIAEVVVYDFALDTPGLTMVRDYLERHWGIPP